MKRYTLKELNELPTLNQGHTSNLKLELEDGKVRVWLSRLGKEDGEKYDNMVIVERLHGGTWKEEKTYQAK